MSKVKINECNNIQAQLSAYYDRELPAWKYHIIRWHLKRCSECNANYAELQRTQTFLNNVEPVKATESLLTSVMSSVNSLNAVHKERRSLVNRLSSFVERFQGWMRGNIRTYNSYYILGFFVGVFMMIGVTLYSPQIDKINLLSQNNDKSINKQERLVAFEVILQPEPKRTLKIR